MAKPAKAPDRVNDFVVKLANVNGTGSASANTLLMKSIFRMGVPVMGKNYFPSNIQGLPTWYEIRVTKDGYVARSGRVDLMVAMNAETYHKDVREVSPGGWLLYDSTWPRPTVLKREDITILGVPLAQLCNENFVGVRNRILMKNVCYVGVLAALLEIDLEVIRGLLGESYAKKQALVDANMKAVQLGYDWAKAHLPCPLPLRIERMDKTSGMIMIDGNTAAALGAIYGGVSFAAWYPITPATSCGRVEGITCLACAWTRRPARTTFAVVQAEDELAAIGMVLGAGWAGARAMTQHQRPGHLADGRVQRPGLLRRGPGGALGHPAHRALDRPAHAHAQGDVLMAYCLGHGDTKHVLLFPARPGGVLRVRLAQAFDLAERLQTPVFVL